MFSLRGREAAPTDATETYLVEITSEQLTAADLARAIVDWGPIYSGYLGLFLLGAARDRARSGRRTPASIIPVIRTLD